MVIVYVALGGALGSVLRYLIGVWFARVAPGSMPWGTLAANALGSILIGVLMVFFSMRGQAESELRIALTVGLLGGFTTYSAFAYELIDLVERKQLAPALLYLALTLGLTLAGCAAGMFLARSLR